MILTNYTLTRLSRPDFLKQKSTVLAIKHDSLSRNTRAQLQHVFDAIRELMTLPDPPK